MSDTSEGRPVRRPPHGPPVPAAVLAGIVDRLQEARGRVGLSPEQLSQAAGLSGAAVRHIERGASVPTLGTLYALCGPLNLLSPASLLPELSPKKPAE